MCLPHQLKTHGLNALLQLLSRTAYSVHTAKNSVLFSKIRNFFSKGAFSFSNRRVTRRFQKQVLILRKKKRTDFFLTILDVYIVVILAAVI